MAKERPELVEANAQAFAEAFIDCLSTTVQEVTPCLRLKENNAAILGPTPESNLPALVTNHYGEVVRRPILAWRQDKASFTTWTKCDKTVKMGNWPTKQEDAEIWYHNRRKIDLDRWKAVKIDTTIDLCFKLPNGGSRAPIAAALCFWDTSSNTFNFRFGQMGITLLDILTITGIPTYYVPYEYGDLNKPYLHNARPDRSYGPYNKWIKAFGTKDHEGGIAFLEYWLCRYIFCSAKMVGDWTILATALYNGEKVGLGHSVLASLYRLLREISLDPFKFNYPGPLWILHFWLQVYFPKFTEGSAVQFSETKLLGDSLTCIGKYTVPCYSECFRYLYFLDKLPGQPVKLVTGRQYPYPLDKGFLPRPVITDDELNVFKYAISCADLRMPKEVLSFELYAPNHFARQLGLVQDIPYPLMDSNNLYTSWRLKIDKSSKRYAEVKKMDRAVDLSHVRDICWSRQVEARYDLWWNTVTVGHWDKEENPIFCSIFCGYKAMNSKEDIEILKQRAGRPANVTQTVPPKVLGKRPTIDEGELLIRKNSSSFIKNCKEHREILERGAAHPANATQDVPLKVLGKRSLMVEEEEPEVPLIRKNSKKYKENREILERGAASPANATQDVPLQIQRRKSHTNVVEENPSERVIENKNPETEGEGGAEEVVIGIVQTPEGQENSLLFENPNVEVDPLTAIPDSMEVENPVIDSQEEPRAEIEDSTPIDEDTTAGNGIQTEFRETAPTTPAASTMQPVMPRSSSLSIAQKMALILGEFFRPISVTSVGQRPRDAAVMVVTQLREAYTSIQANDQVKQTLESLEETLASLPSAHGVLLSEQAAAKIQAQKARLQEQISEKKKSVLRRGPILSKGDQETREAQLAEVRARLAYAKHKRDLQEKLMKLDLDACEYLVQALDKADKALDQAKNRRQHHQLGPGG